MTCRAAAIVFALAACGTSDDATDASTTSAPTIATDGGSAPSASPTSPMSPTSPTDGGPATTSDVTSDTGQSTLPATTVAATVPVPVCDRDEATALLDATIGLARLDPAGAWSDDTSGVAFDDRTDTGAEFARLQGYDCGLRLAQRTDAGAERLALVAWNDLRHSLVIQATDVPSIPYTTDIRFQLLIEQTSGEWLDDQFVWAATMEGGETIVIGTRDTSIALAAKSWQAAVPPFDDLPVTLDSERYGIDVLGAAGARLVSVAEPAPYDSELGSIQLHTPLALPAFAVVAPAGVLDPMVPIVPDGDTTLHEVDDVTVRLTVGLELGQFLLFETGWTCDGFAWRLYSGYGTPDEVLEFAAQVVATACG